MLRIEELFLDRLPQENPEVCINRTLKLIRETETVEEISEILQPSQSIIPASVRGDSQNTEVESVAEQSNDYGFKNDKENKMNGKVDHKESSKSPTKEKEKTEKDKDKEEEEERTESAIEEAKKEEDKKFIQFLQYMIIRNDRLK